MLYYSSCLAGILLVFKKEKIQYTVALDGVQIQIRVQNQKKITYWQT